MQQLIEFYLLEISILANIKITISIEIIYLNKNIYYSNEKL